MIEGIPENLATSMCASFQHIDLIRSKEARLEQARTDSLHQVLHRIGTEYSTGGLTHAELCAALAAVRAQNIRGAMSAWDEIVGVSWKRTLQLAKQLPNGPEGSWVGEYPFHPATVAPIAGVPVVYVLFDEANEPCYVGSTHGFRPRMTAHHKSGKRFVRWQAHPCRDREHAYEIEEQLLAQHMPYLNRRRGR